MQIYGYGYRKNCFGERMFYEDEIETHSRKGVKRILTKGFERMYRDTEFTLKVVTDAGATWAVSRCPGREKNGLYTVLYSPAWNVTNPEKVIKKNAIIDEIAGALEE